MDFLVYVLVIFKFCDAIIQQFVLEGFRVIADELNEYAE